MNIIGYFIKKSQKKAIFIGLFSYPITKFIGCYLRNIAIFIFLANMSSNLTILFTISSEQIDFTKLVHFIPKILHLIIEIIRIITVLDILASNLIHLFLHTDVNLLTNPTSSIRLFYNKIFVV